MEKGINSSFMQMAYEVVDKIIWYLSWIYQANVTPSYLFVACENL